MESFQIRFRHDPSSCRPNNSFGLTGSGTLEVGGLVRISAKKRRPFRFAAESILDLDPVQIANVQCGGKSIRFEVLAGGDIHKPGFLQMELQDEASAQRLAQLLPVPAPRPLNSSSTSWTISGSASPRPRHGPSSPPPSLPSMYSSSPP